MTDEEILYEFIDLSKSDMTEEEKDELMDIILKYQDAFSLRDEIGECPNIRVDRPVPACTVSERLQAFCT